MSEVSLKARLTEGGTPKPDNWGIDSEYAPLRDVLLGPAESFYWMDDNKNFSSIARATLASGEKLDRVWTARGLCSGKRGVKNANTDSTTNNVKESIATRFRRSRRQASFPRETPLICAASTSSRS